MLDADSVGLLISWSKERIVLWRGIGITLPSPLNQVRGLKVFPSHCFPFELLRIEEIYLLQSAKPGGSHRPDNSKL